MELNKKIPLVIHFEIGRTRKKIDHLLKITKGTVFRLEESEVNIVQIMLENKKIGKGKILTKDGKLYVEIIEINHQ